LKRRNGLLKKINYGGFVRSYTFLVFLRKKIVALFCF
jgi:hypothetical protein